jgi:hypothetical protein
VKRKLHGWVFAGFTLGISGAACEAPRARLTIETEWIEDRPEPGTVDIYGSILDSGGRVVANSGDAIRFTGDTPVEFDRVPFGPELRVEIRMVPAGEADSETPLYFGRSAPFDFSPGDRRRVPVPMSLLRAPRIPGGQSLRLLNGRTNRVSSPELQLELRARGAERIEVAQDIDFTVGYVRFPAADVRVDSTDEDDGDTELFRWSYDLNESREECRESPSICEGARRILVRVSRAGFTSRPLDLPLVLDTVPPDITRASIAYTPSDENPLSNVTAATDGTEIRVTLSFDEPLDVQASPLELRASNGTVALDFRQAAPIPDGATSASFVARVERDQHIEGIYIPEIAISDSAGNLNPAASFDDSPIRVDLSADRFVLRQSAVSYIRSPIGNPVPETLRNEEGQEVFTLPEGAAFYELGPPDGLEPISHLPPDVFSFDGTDSVALIRFWATEEREILLGRASSNELGEWPREQLRLADRDSPRVWVSGVDEAGNESRPVRVENAWYVASTALSALGESPHRTELSARSKAPLEAGTSIEDRSSVESPDGVGAIQVSGKSWTRFSAGTPAAQQTHAMAYDSARARVVLFSSGGRPETWEWDGVSWLNVTPARGNAPPRNSSDLVYDSIRGRVVMFGGSDNLGRTFADTWEWDGRTWRSAGVEGPPGRSSHAMAFDAARGCVVLHGGLNEAFEPMSDTWTWDGVQWTEVTPPEDNPPARGHHQMAFDSIRGRVVMFGGDGTDGLLADTWEWTGSKWQRIEASGPPALDSYALAFDRARGRTVLYGGFGEGSRSSRTWLWDGTEWEERTPPGGSPDGRIWHRMTYDSGRERVVMFGGNTGANVLLADTWEWDGQNWEERTPSAAAPSSVDGHGMVYDEDRERTVLFGGRGSGAFEEIAETWEWDGSRWTDRSLPAAESPPRRSFFGMAYHRGRDRTVVFGGFVREATSVRFLDDTWEWDGSEWIERQAVGESPEPRDVPALVYDSDRDVLLLFGGRGQDFRRRSDTWQWDGTGWSELEPAGRVPGARGFHKMAYDEDRRRVVLFGGQTDDGSRLADTWEWDGATSTWNERDPPGRRPPPTSGYDVAYDPVDATTLLFGGSGTIGAALWAWNGSRWLEKPFVSEAPSARSGHAMVLDTRRDRLVLFGGTGVGDTWEFGAPSEAPLAQLSVALPPDISKEDLQGLRVRAFCGGEATGPDSTPVSGTELRGWVTGGPGNPAGGWVSLLENTASTHAEANERLMDYRPTEDEASDRVRSLFGPDRNMFFQCRTRGSSSQSRLSLDYMEVRVRYGMSP